MNKKGGILFPPNCFTKEFLRSDIFLKQSPINDELWYWIMALVHERKIRVIKNHNKHSIALNIFNFLKEG